MEEPASDDILQCFQDLRSRESKRTASLAARQRILFRVTLIVWVVVGVLFILTLPRLLRYVTETDERSLLQGGLDFVEVNYAHQQR